jgi:hypothetical protein
LDFTVFYLDDGYVAGTGDAVAWFCEQLRAELANIGLTVSADKCIVSPSSGPTSVVDPALFGGWQWNASCNVKVLGAAVGDATFCSALVGRRRAKAAKTMARIRELNDSQGALTLLRSCSSFSKLLYNARTTPSCNITAELNRFDEDVRACFCDSLRLDTSDLEWSRAQLATRLGGVGLRSLGLHSRAAFVSSVASTVDLQCAVWSFLSPERVWAEPEVAEAIAALSDLLPQTLVVGLSNGDSISQKALSGAIDRGRFNDASRDPAVPEHMKAHMNLVSAEGADAWLHAVPSDEKRSRLPSELFRLSVARWLRLRLVHDHCTCPCCGQGLDAYMDHALVCSCGGDRTLRHNAIRNAFFTWSLEAGIVAEKEKPGLLPARPGEEALCGERLCSGKRPADVWLNPGPDGNPCAVDFAVSSGLRADCVRTAVEDTPAIWGMYEHFKRQHDNTQARCLEQRLTFIPFVVEADGGGLGPAARRLCGFVSQVGAAREGQEVEVKAADLLRCISCSLQRENARAVLRRLPRGCLPDAADGNAAAWATDGADDAWQ